MHAVISCVKSCITSTIGKSIHENHTDSIGAVNDFVEKSRSLEMCLLVAVFHQLATQQHNSSLKHATVLGLNWGGNNLQRRRHSSQYLIREILDATDRKHSSIRVFNLNALSHTS